MPMYVAGVTYMQVFMKQRNCTCCRIDTGGDPDSSSNALTPSVTHPAGRARYI